VRSNSERILVPLGRHDETQAPQGR
jgi:hypothetical protein